MKLKNLHDLFNHELQDLSSAEEQIIKALPKMIEKATNQELQDGLSNHLEKTKEHAEIVKQVATECGFSAKGDECKGMKGLLQEGEDIISLSGGDDVRDAAIIIAAQRVEHYEISA